MALVTVLLMITVFSMIGISVINLAISNTKQVEKTEQDMKAVDVAEMGIIYYKNAFISQADQVLRTAVGNAITRINQKNDDHTDDVDYVAIPITTATILQEMSVTQTANGELGLRQFLPPIDLTTATVIDENPNYSFRLEDLTVNETLTIGYTNYVITILFESVGKGIDDEASIIGKIALNVKGVINDSFNTSGGSGGTTTGATSIKKPTVSKLCTYVDVLEDDCAYRDTITDTDYGEKKTENITTVVNGSLTLQDNKKLQIDHSFLYITEDATFGEFNGNISDLTLFVGRNATFSDVSGGIKDQSTLRIVGNANFGEKVSAGVTDSTVCVGGTISGGLSFSNANVYKWQDHQDMCGRFGEPDSTPSDLDLNELLPNIVDQVNEMELSYD